jgi:ERCC4-related helicase
MANLREELEKATEQAFKKMDEQELIAKQKKDMSKQELEKATEQAFKKMVD